jgi:hypothetical protein
VEEEEEEEEREEAGSAAAGLEELAAAEGSAPARAAKRLAHSTAGALLRKRRRSLSMAETVRGRWRRAQCGPHWQLSGKLMQELQSLPVHAGWQSWSESPGLLAVHTLFVCLAVPTARQRFSRSPLAAPEALYASEPPSLPHAPPLQASSPARCSCSCSRPHSSLCLLLCPLPLRPLQQQLCARALLLLREAAAACRGSEAAGLSGLLPELPCSSRAPHSPSDLWRHSGASGAAHGALHRQL